MHPNCRHAFTAYIPGLTTLDENTEDPEGEANRKKLRQLERDVRQTKRQMAGATGAAAQKHEARLKDLQAKIRQHVDSTGVRRSRRREQINLALGDEPIGKVHSDGLLNANTADFRTHKYRLPQPGDKGRPKRKPPTTSEIIGDDRRDLDNPDQNAHFSATERLTAERLRTLGFDVRSVKKVNDASSPDALIGDTVVEFKSVGEPTRRAVEEAVKRSRKQSRNLVLDVRASGMTERQAAQNFARTLGNTNGAFDRILLLGNDFQILWP